jgi:hypothetical protein
MKYWKIKLRIRAGVENEEFCENCPFSRDERCPEDCENLVSWVEPSEGE